MPHTLSFHIPYKSITSINTINIPDFCLVTGKNGSGKSHLLEAIEKGRVKTSLTENFSENVALFDSATIIPNDTGSYSPAQASAQENQKFKQILSGRDKVPHNVQILLKSWGLDTERVKNMEDVIELSDKDNFLSSFPENSNLSNLYDGFNRQLGVLASGLVPNQRNQNRLDTKLQELGKKDPKLLLTGSEHQIFRHEDVEKPDTEAFQQAFGKIFTDYRKKLLVNAAKQLEDRGQKPLSEKKFTEKFGPRPWDFVNNILEVSNLDFRINSPNLEDPFGSFEPRLTKVSSGVEMKFDDLSSGERVLMSFALCLYNSSENMGAGLFPKLLLLDEIDAPLHPDMVSFVLKTIREVLVEKHKICVIATTHSPTTVALFDDNSIFEMSAEGPSLDKISKDRALSVLTAGVPTVSVSYSQRNQIFVESETDAKVLSVLYQIFKSLLDTERSVEFIKSGRKSDTGNEENAGCPRVKSVVEDLRKAGVNTVFGLIDWDGKNISEQGIQVLCEGSRYSIENLILDPVVVLAALAKEFTGFAKKKRLLSNSDTFVGLINWNESQWQTATDKLMKILDLQGEEKTTVSYRNNMKLSFARRYLEMRGHDLVELVCKKIHPFDGKRKQGNLEFFLAQNVVPEVKELVPREMLILFQNLTALGPHQD